MLINTQTVHILAAERVTDDSMKRNLTDQQHLNKFFIHLEKQFKPDKGYHIIQNLFISSTLNINKYYINAEFMNI